MNHGEFSLWISGAALVAYAFWWTTFLRPWIKLKKIQHLENGELSILNGSTESAPFKKQLTIIIPFRNESQRISPLLKSLTQLQFSGDLEVIFCNDHSTDNGTEIIQEWSEQQSFDIKILNASPSEIGKKAALAMGISHAMHPIILTTDADCCFHPNNANEMLNALISNEADLAIGRVDYLWVNDQLHNKKGRNNLLQVYQQMENQALIAIGFAESQKHNAAVANGANLMFKKQAFIDLGGYQGHEHIASGDDIFTLEKFILSPIHKITYVQHPSATVYTPLETRWDSFFHQRMRWMKKTFLQKTQKTALKQVLVGLFMIFIWVMSAIAVLSAHYETLAFVWLGKLLVDSAGVHILLSNNKPNPICVLLASAAQVLWLPALAITSTWSKYQWKNRQHTA
jgi:cellulose synthase/poly-beta-1,6-N-acetylglucosamine synthase-like glycosyltransferase